MGKFKGFPAFFVKDSTELEDDDTISVKKCLVNLSQAYTTCLMVFAEKKFQASALKKLSLFLAKVIASYPFA